MLASSASSSVAAAVGCRRASFCSGTGRPSPRSPMLLDDSFVSRPFLAPDAVDFDVVVFDEASKIPCPRSNRDEGADQAPVVGPPRIPLESLRLAASVRSNSLYRSAVDLPVALLKFLNGRLGNKSTALTRVSLARSLESRPTSRETVMTTATSDIDIDIPISTVYNQWTQFEDFPAFMKAVEEVRQVNDDTLHWRVKIGGVEREFDARITEQHPDDRIAWKSISGPDHAGSVTFHRLNDTQTRLRLQLDWEPEGFAEKAGAVLQIDDAQVGADLTKFKELIESNGFETGAWRGNIDRPEDETGR